MLIRASNSNDSERLRYLVNISRKKPIQTELGLLKMLRNTALSQRKVLGQPIDELKIDTENRNNFRILLMAQPLGTATREDIDELYKASIKSESFSA